MFLKLKRYRFSFPCILSKIFVMHSFTYGFLFYNKNSLSWFTSFVPILSLKVFRHEWSIIKTPFSVKCLLKSELHIFVFWGCLLSPISVLSGFRNSWVSVLEITCLCWEHFPTKNGCLGFVLIIPIVIMT